MVRPEEHEEKGCIRFTIKDDLYPGLEVEGVSPRFYYHKTYHDQDEYSKRLLNTKAIGEDDSAYFNPFIEDCIKKFNDELNLSKINIITAIPNRENKYHSNLINIAKHIGTILDKPSRLLFNRELTPKNTTRGRLARYNDVHGKFKLRELIDVKGKSILLLDDIRSSGMSLLECSQVLIEGGASKVVAITLGTNSSNVPPKNGGV